MVSSESPGKDLPFLPSHFAEMEGREGGRMEEDMRLWRDGARWEGGPKPGTILETCAFVKLQE